MSGGCFAAMLFLRVRRCSCSDSGYKQGNARVFAGFICGRDGGRIWMWLMTGLARAWASVIISAWRIWQSCRLVRVNLHAIIEKMHYLFGSSVINQILFFTKRSFCSIGINKERNVTIWIANVSFCIGRWLYIQISNFFSETLKPRKYIAFGNADSNIFSPKTTTVLTGLIMNRDEFEHGSGDSLDLRPILKCP